MLSKNEYCELMMCFLRSQNWTGTGLECSDGNQGEIYMQTGIEIGERDKNGRIRRQGH